MAEFAGLDQTDSGFISTDDLPTLLSRLNRDDLAAPNRIEAVKRAVDADGMGIVLWQSLWPVLQEQSSAAEPWACDACTFINMSDVASCEICMTPAPARNVT